MSAELLIANMLRIAREDLDGAIQLSATGNRNAIYLCEQAFRYPTSAGRIPGAPVGNEFTEIVQKVETALKEAALRLGVDLARKGTSAARSGPVR